jgi:DNA mismatch repair protein MutS
MQQQYHDLKSQYPNDLLLFRLGDFYETFEQDALDASKILGITLTGRGKAENRVPMAGIPFHALDNYLPRLLQAGRKVAVVEQLTDPQPGQKLVERAVTKVYTPGTVVAEHSLAEAKQNYLAALHQDVKRKTFGVCLAEASTGELLVWEDKDLERIFHELTRREVKEIVVCDTKLIPEIYVEHLSVTLRAAVDFTPEFGEEMGRQLLHLPAGQAGVKSLKSFGVDSLPAAAAALGAALNYLLDCHRVSIGHFTKVEIYNYSNYMLLDNYTIANLELVTPRDALNWDATVYYHLNQCQTNMGKRLLREWLLHPLIESSALVKRWDGVDYFFTNTQQATELSETLRLVPDLERITGRIGTGTANARDLLALRDGLTSSQQIATLLATSDSELFNQLLTSLRADQIANVVELISQAIHPEPPAGLTDGYLIAPGYSPEIDELRSLRSGGREVISSIQAREAERTGISNLKVSYNRVFGYYIEITNSHSAKVPANYIRKQTLANAERYITQELKEWEEKVLTAEDKLLKLEYQLFIEIRNKVGEAAAAILAAAAEIAKLDIFVHWGLLAKAQRYVRPSLSSETKPVKAKHKSGAADSGERLLAHQLHITAGRHLVVENIQGKFTPNDCDFSADQTLQILTGPNMSGKSTYIRQIALLILLAQIGCFVPATKMEFSICDRIFTRVGASDNLSRGESTFMVEMQETANILHHATDRSLIILDEVGRGTSTYDGVALAWSIAEYLAKETKAFTLFATHYHELTGLSEKLKNVTNHQVEVLEEGKEILFTHKIKPGSIGRSYGVHVAKMAGVPAPVVKRAEEILHNLEKQSRQSDGQDKAKDGLPSQLSLF